MTDTASNINAGAYKNPANPATQDNIAGILSSTRLSQQEAYSTLYRIRRALRGNIPETDSDKATPSPDGIVSVAHSAHAQARELAEIALEIEKLTGEM